jgi:eukaryotic-like serine/threonine-protein kinase
MNCFVIAGNRRGMNRFEKILGKYEVLNAQPLGTGAHSTIYAVKDKNNHVYAIKHVVRNTPEQQRFIDQVVAEHQIAQKIDHPTIRKSFKLIRRGLLKTNEVYVLMELVDGMTLEQYKFETMLDFCQVMQKVSDGLGAFHAAGFVHADIKPNNIMVDDKQVVKIIDFGQSCPIGTVKQRIQGTPDYIAPEQVKRKQITPETDVYNLGATMYFLLTKTHVPTIMPSAEPSAAMKPSKECKPVRDLNPEVPPALSSLVMHCIAYEPADRPQSMNQIHQRLAMAMSQINRPGVEAAKPSPAPAGR